MRPFRTVIVCRIVPGIEGVVGGVFGHYHSITRPQDLGVIGRRIPSHHGLYIHTVERREDPTVSGQRRGLPAFQEISEEVGPSVPVLVPRMNPGRGGRRVDAVANGFYRWQGRGPAAGTSWPRRGLTCGSSVSRPALTHTGPVGSAKQLICPTCGNVIADAQHRRWQARVVVTSVDGERVRPTSLGLLLALARQRGEQDRLDWLQAHAEELVLDLTCPRGHTVLTAVPDLVRTMRTTPGRWVTPPGPLGPNRPPGGPA